MTRDGWVNACGKLPRCSPRGPSSSAKSPKVGGVTQHLLEQELRLFQIARARPVALPHENQGNIGSLSKSLDQGHLPLYGLDPCHLQDEGTWQTVKQRCNGERKISQFVSRLGRVGHDHSFSPRRGIAKTGYDRLHLRDRVGKKDIRGPGSPEENKDLRQDRRAARHTPACPAPVFSAPAMPWRLARRRSHPETDLTKILWTARVRAGW